MILLLDPFFTLWRMWQLSLKSLKKKEAQELFSRYDQIITEGSLLAQATLPVIQI